MAEINSFKKIIYKIKKIKITLVILLLFSDGFENSF